jgi:hypothetical protein
MLVEGLPELLDRLEVRWLGLVDGLVIQALENQLGISLEGYGKALDSDTRGWLEEQALEILVGVGAATSAYANR